MEVTFEMSATVVATVVGKGELADRERTKLTHLAATAEQAAMKAALFVMNGGTYELPSLPILVSHARAMELIIAHENLKRPGTATNDLWWALHTNGVVRFIYTSGGSELDHGFIKHPNRWSADLTTVDTEKLNKLSPTMRKRFQFLLDAGK